MKPLAIDLGLSVRWADRDLGADELHLPGKRIHTSGKYGFRVEELNEYLNKLIKKELGQRWRLPTEREVRELQEKCTITPSVFIRQLSNNKEQRTPGIKITGPSRKYVFMLAETRILSYKGMSPAFWETGSSVINVPYCNDILETTGNKDQEYEKDNLPFRWYYGINGYGLPIRPVTDEEPSGRDSFLRLLEYPLDPESRIEETGNRLYFPPQTIREEYSPREKENRYHQRLEVERRRRDEQERRERVERQRLLDQKDYCHKVEFSFHWWDSSSGRSGYERIFKTFIHHDVLMALIQGGEAAQSSFIKSLWPRHIDRVYDITMYYNLTRYTSSGRIL